MTSPSWPTPIAILIGVMLAARVLAADVPPATAPSPFCIGADISSLPQVEAAGGVFKDRGVSGDALTILKAHGVTHGRLRIWSQPKDGRCGLEQTLAMARRLHAASMPWLLDFHYSDTWADPAHQPKPAAWEKLAGRELEDAVLAYTRDVIAELDRRGTPPAMVQIGNEITPGMLWPDGKLGGQGDEVAARWTRFARLVKAGIRGVREGRGGKPPIAIVIHVDCGGNNATCCWFFDHLLAEGVEFDVIGLSYYPWWHGPREKLQANLNDLARRYRKDLIVVETSWPWSPQGRDRDREPGETFAMSVAGQKEFLAELVRIVKGVEDGRGKGVYYWEPAWIPAPKAGSPWTYRTLFGNDGELLESVDGLGGETAR